MQDALGDRMKKQYEDRTRYMLPRRTYTIIRVDGKAFHTYCKAMKFRRPFDEQLRHSLDAAAIELCHHIQGAKFAFVQSDEISILATDFDAVETQAWFDGNVQKLCSISASIVTATFNVKIATLKDEVPVPAFFDARVFSIPDYVEVENYFIWRQKDAERNSIQMLARCCYSHKELDGKGIPELHEMLHKKGTNWANQPNTFKRGRLISYLHEGELGFDWAVWDPTPIFTREREILRGLIPRHWQEDNDDIDLDLQPHAVANR